MLQLCPVPILIFPVQTSTVTVHSFKRPKISNFRWQSLQSITRTDELHICESIRLYVLKHISKHLVTTFLFFFFFNKLSFLMTAVCVLVLYHIRFYCRPEGEIFNKSTTLKERWKSPALDVLNAVSIISKSRGKVHVYKSKFSPVADCKCVSRERLTLNPQLMWKITHVCNHELAFMFCSCKFWIWRLQLSNKM